MDKAVRKYIEDFVEGGYSGFEIGSVIGYPVYNEHYYDKGELSKTFACFFISGATKTICPFVIYGPEKMNENHVYGAMSRMVNDAVEYVGHRTGLHAVEIKESTPRDSAD